VLEQVTANLKGPANLDLKDMLGEDGKASPGTGNIVLDDDMGGLGPMG